MWATPVLDHHAETILAMEFIPIAEQVGLLQQFVDFEYLESDVPGSAPIVDGALTRS